MPTYTDVLKDQHGNPVPGAHVRVLDRAGNPANLSSRSGGPQDNPVVTSVDGVYTFVVVEGSYTLEVFFGGRLVTTKPVQIGGLVAFIEASPENAGKYLGLNSEGAPEYKEGVAGLEKLTDSSGSSLVGYGSRSVKAKLDDVVSVLDFGADPTGLVDSTDAFNRATAAAESHVGNFTALKRGVHVPRGSYKLGAGNKSVYVRKGQHLYGDGMGATFIDARGNENNTNPIFQFGTGSESGGVEDPGGLASEWSGMWVFGGPSVAAIAKFNGAGWAAHDLFITSSGQGIYAGGGDGLIYNCIIEQGLTGIVIDGQNIVVSACLFYIMAYQIRVVRAFDCEINNCHFEYPQYGSISVGDSASNANIRGLTIRGNTFVMNGQYETFQAYIGLFCQNASVSVVGGNTFRNMRGPAISHLSGLGNRVLVQDAVFDGDRTNLLYDQSSTCQAIDGSNMHVTVRGSTFQNLRGQPIVMGGSVDATLLVQGCSFRNCTGGTSDIGITNGNPGTSSRVVLTDVVGSGRLLYNPQSAVPVTTSCLQNWLDPISTSGSRRYVMIPHQGGNVFSVAFRANANPVGNPEYLQTTVYALRVKHAFNGNAATVVSVTDTLPNEADGVSGTLTVAAELNAVGGGAGVAGFLNSGFVALSWSTDFARVALDVQKTL